MNRMTRQRLGLDSELGEFCFSTKKYNSLGTCTVAKPSQLPTEKLILPHLSSIPCSHESSSLYDSNDIHTNESNICFTSSAENDFTDTTYSIENDSSFFVNSDTESKYDNNRSEFMPSPKRSASEAAFSSASSAFVNPDISLYPGAPITMHATLLLILAYILAHNVTKNAAEDLLNLINILLTKPNKFPTSLYLFYKVLNIDILEPVKHYFCKLCETPIPKEDDYAHLAIKKRSDISLNFL